MITLVHTAFTESDNKLSLAVRFENPLTGNGYTFRCGLVRFVRSNVEDTAGYTRRIEDLQRSIEQSNIR